MSDPEREYRDAKAAYGKALARLIAAKKARPKPVIREGSLAHKAQVREAIWQAYLAGERNYAALARRFARTPGNISTVIRDALEERAFGPITPEEHAYQAELEAEAARWRFAHPQYFRHQTG